MFRRILVPLDGSELAEKVLPLAEAEASDHGATLVLFRVVPRLRQGLMLVPSVLDDLNQQVLQLATDYMDRVAGELRRDGIAVETEVQLGKPAESILAFAEGTGCDLIIIASHGQSGARQWRFGSVANKVIKMKTTMPVMVVNT